MSERVMQTIGLVGGLSWHSTLEYYRLLNELTADRLGKEHVAELVLIHPERAGVIVGKDPYPEFAIDSLSQAALNLERAGADFFLLCSNGVHRFAPKICEHVTIPLLHIVEATADAVVAAGLSRVGLLGVKRTMEGSFYPEGLARRGVTTITPTDEERDEVVRIIYEELVFGEVRDESRSVYRRIIQSLAERGAEGIILGCTEIPLLIGPQDSVLPVFSTTEIHARAAVDRAVAGISTRA